MSESFRQCHDAESLIAIWRVPSAGQISKYEMCRFLRTVYALNGEKHSMYSIGKEVDVMFASIEKPKNIGFLNLKG